MLVCVPSLPPPSLLYMDHIGTRTSAIALEKRTGTKRSVVGFTSGRMQADVSNQSRYRVNQCARTLSVLTPQTDVVIDRVRTSTGSASRNIAATRPTVNAPGAARLAVAAGFCDARCSGRRVLSQNAAAAPVYTADLRRLRRHKTACCGRPA